MQIHQLYAAPTTEANDLAHIDVPRSCDIVAIAWFMSFTTFATGDECVMELSNASAGMPTTNDATSVLDVCGLKLGFTTSGAIQNSIMQRTYCKIPLKTNDRIYLHATNVNGTITITVRCLVHLSI